jgi:pyruvate/2-oxoacid:ferredoxin oxidoreductase beta subunit
MSQVMIRDSIPRTELLDGGHLACPGCGAPLAMRMVLKELGEKTIVVLPACCWSIIAGPYPQSSLHVPLYHTAFATGAAVASGIRAALDFQGDTDTTVMVWAGDGGTFDIGLQALSGAAERNENFLYVCYDNEAYMNTGIQRSSATPRGAWTTTTPATAPEGSFKKDILAIMAAHRIPWAATAAISHPVDLLAKVQRARSIRGTRFLHILSPCPPGWKYADDETVEMSRLAVRSRVFPLLEVTNGTHWRFTVDEPLVPLADYVRRQGRFRHIDDDALGRLQGDVDARWEALRALSERQPGDLDD